jgi:small subunit ribosomal protein S3
MGQKIHPIGLRLKITRGWDSRWFQDKKYTEWLYEDYQIRKFVKNRLKNAGISRIEIERADKVNVIINTAKPGLVIGKKGAGIEDLRRSLDKEIGKPVKVTVLEIKNPELEAGLVADNIVEQLEKRVAFRRAMKQAVSRSMKAGAKGIKVQCSGRLAGAEIARSERTFEGKVPLHTLRADIDYALREAFTTYGQIGVKVWIYRGDILPIRAERKKDEHRGSVAMSREGQ